VQNGQNFTTNASFTNEGTLVANNGSSFTTTGNFTQLSIGTFETGIAGTTQLGQLTANGSATLDGTLDVVLQNGFQPQNGDQYQILNYGSVIGDFAAFNFPTLGGGLSFNPVLNPTNLVLQVV
jgi:hypothetical protein